VSARTRWWCKACARGLCWNGKNRKDTITVHPKYRPGKPIVGPLSFTHDGKCGGQVLPIKDCKRSVTEG